jgi:hypothetical protein
MLTCAGLVLWLLMDAEVPHEQRVWTAQPDAHNTADADKSGQAVTDGLNASDGGGLPSDKDPGQVNHDPRDDDTDQVNGNGPHHNGSQDADSGRQDGSSSEDRAPDASAVQRRPAVTDPQVIRDHFRRDEWPIDNSIVTGFEFRKDQYAQLNHWSIEQDVTWPAVTSTALHIMPQESQQALRGRGDTAAWNPKTKDYDVGVIRALTIRHPEADENLNMRIYVLPSPKAAADVLLGPYEGASGNYRGSARVSLDTHVVIGTVAIFNTFGHNWQPEETRSMALLRHNVIVTLSSVARDDDGRIVEPELQVLQLALDIDRDIESQRFGTVATPVVNVELDRDSVVRPSDGWGGRQPQWEDIDFSWSAVTQGEAPATFLLRARREPVSDSTAEQPVEGVYKYRVGTGLSVDDWEYPTRVTMGYTLHAGYYHIGIVAWGPNLLPSVGFAPLEVIQDVND